MENTHQFPGVSPAQEEAHLTRTLAVIEHNLTEYGQEVSRLRQEIDDMLDHFHDDNPELINTLENTMTRYDNLKRALERNEKAMNKPYFGRIVFHDIPLDRQESLYIGKGGIARDATHQEVIDWRAPVANAYYENGLGPCSYPSPDGEYPINLQMKRTYEIEKGKLISFYDSEVVANDELLTKYLSKNKQAVLNEIVATIQKEQNDIIRKSPYHNCLVQGVAGSGKTTVAMHRISFILYNYAERFRPEDFYIVGSNRILLNYITGVLPDLDVYGVRQMTMEQLFVRLLYEDWNEKKYHIRPVSDALAGAVRGTLSWYRDLADFCSRLEQRTIQGKDIYLNPPEGGEPVLLVAKDAVERYVAQNPTLSIQTKINMLNDRLLNRIKDEFTGKDITYAEELRGSILAPYRNYYGPRQRSTSIYDLYEDFLREQFVKGYPAQSPEDAFDVYDLAALAYLYKRVKETEVISEAHHIVIDEAQDYGMMAYSVLKFCINSCTYTIMGDVSQNIHFGCGLNDWEELKALYLQDSKASFCTLRKSYRNTIEISQFATDILKHGSFSPYPVEPIIRHGRSVQVLEQTSRQTLLRQAAHVCKAWQAKGLETIAIVCRDKAEAAKVTRELSTLLPLMESDLEKAEFGNGILVLPVEYTKGLEFDAVLIFNPTRDAYPVDDGHAKLLYVAATRALHELCILHTGSLTGLIADPIPKRENPQGQEMTSDKEMPSSMATADTAPPRISLPKPAARPRAVASIGSAAGATMSVRTRSRYDSSPYTRSPQSKPVISTAPSPGTASAHSPASSQTASAAFALPRAAFGDAPANELLRAPGHARIDCAVRMVTKEADGLYLRSRCGTLLLSPVTSSIVRVTFAREGQLPREPHPAIALKGNIRTWMYKTTPSTVELMTESLWIQAEKSTGHLRYLTLDKKLLLAERNKEPRQFGSSPAGVSQNRLYLDWFKNETPYTLNQDNRPIKLPPASASHISRGGALPFLFSDKGYGLLPAHAGDAYVCSIPSFGQHLYTEGGSVFDYYFIAGEDVQALQSQYHFLLPPS